MTLPHDPLPHNPLPCAKLFKDVHGALRHLHAHWRIYHAFFGPENRRQFVVAYRAAPNTFSIIEQLLSGEILIGAARLLGPALSVSIGGVR